MYLHLTGIKVEFGIFTFSLELTEKIFPWLKIISTDTGPLGDCTARYSLASCAETNLVSHHVRLYGAGQMQE